MYSPRLIQLLTAAARLLPGESQVNSESILKLLRDNVPHATQAQAWLDVDGTYARYPFDLLPIFMPGVDFSQETPELIAEAIGALVGPYWSTMHTGKLQTNLNGDGRSVLAEARPMRQGKRRAGARYISDDPDAVTALNIQRNRRVVSAAMSARGTHDMSISRQPELAARLGALMLQSRAEVDILMTPLPPAAPTAALPTPQTETTS